MREAVAASGQVQNARTACGMAPIVRIAVRGRAAVGLSSVHLAGRRLRGLEQRLRRPFGMVDEGVAVALEAVDHLVAAALGVVGRVGLVPGEQGGQQAHVGGRAGSLDDQAAVVGEFEVGFGLVGVGVAAAFVARSEEHTSELQSLMRISYAVFCLKKKKQNITMKDNKDTRQ